MAANLKNLLKLKEKLRNNVRATEFIDLIYRKDLPEIEDYSHLEIHDNDGKLIKSYKKLRKNAKRNKN